MGALRVLLALAALCCFAMFGASAKVCRLVPRNEIWKHAKGKFVNKPDTKVWSEFDADGKEIAQFTERLRQGNQVILFDRKRNLQILLQEDLAATNSDGGTQYSQLYQGEWSKVIDCT
eukprot:TRINITY_DN37573_c0_g1_i1.p1 TRINITY_DN37573_c0_g1~~TRINITY_DN37573_c0_g1_i1.p1  ORF type:complete len:118 (+),score=41.33 TRINITY_DN37573_c0_g1_i1:62-415(+)